MQTSFVVGSVYLKSSFRLVQGLHFHPVIFAFVREAIAGPVLFCIAYATTGERCGCRLGSLAVRLHLSSQLRLGSQRLEG